MLEPYEGKLSRTVLRGERESNLPDLLDPIVNLKNIGQNISILTVIFFKLL